MKRYIDYFRIKGILIATIGVLLIVFIMPLVHTLGEDFDDRAPSIAFKNAPENTAYVDILVKLPESSADYVDFAEWAAPAAELSITPDSEIAKLNDEGYVSLSVHYRGCVRLSKTGQLLLNDDIITVSKRYGRFKAAYVDSSGNVLMITKTSQTRYAAKKPSGFALNGDTLTFTISSPSPLQLVLFIISLIGEPLAIIALIVCTVLDKRQNKHLHTRPSSD